MAIETEVKELGIRKNKRQYPYIGKFPENGLVVLFNRRVSGIVLSTYEKPTPEHKLGFYGNDWNEDAFIPLSETESVILRNI